MPTSGLKKYSTLQAEESPNEGKNLSQLMYLEITDLKQEERTGTKMTGLEVLDHPLGHICKLLYHGEKTNKKGAIK